MARTKSGSFDTAITALELGAQILPDEDTRIYLVIINSGANTVRIGIGNDADAGTGATLAAGARIEFFNENNCPTEYISAYSVAGTTVTVISVKRI